MWFQKLSKLLKLARVFSRAKVVVWDLDGTLYDHSKLLFVLRERWCQYYVNHTTASAIDFSEQEARGKDWYQILQRVSPKSIKQLCIEVESTVIKSDFVEPSNLVATYFNHSNKQHFLFTNATRAQAIAILKKIGVSKPSQNFKKMLTLDELPDAKPAPAAYDYLLKKLAIFKPSEILFIGDSLKNDILPAQKYGFETIFITYGGEPSSFATLNFISTKVLFSYLRKLKLLSSVCIY